MTRRQIAGSVTARGELRRLADSAMRYCRNADRVSFLRRTMAKSREVFVCDQCGNESLQWQGLCPMCGAGLTAIQEGVP